MTDGGAAQSGRARRGGGASQNGRRGRLRAPDAAALAVEPLKEKPWGVAAPPAPGDGETGGGAAGAMLSSGAKAAKPSFVSYVSPEVRGGAGLPGPRSGGESGSGAEGAPWGCGGPAWGCGVSVGLWGVSSFSPLSCRVFCWCFGSRSAR